MTASDARTHLAKLSCGKYPRSAPQRDARSGRDRTDMYPVPAGVGFRCGSEWL